jgi:hypothetical protein
MQGEEAYPTCGMDGVLVWMMPPLADLGWYVMDCDDPVEDRYDHENEQPKCEIVQEWIVYLIDQFSPTPLSFLRFCPSSHRACALSLLIRC